MVPAFYGRHRVSANGKDTIVNFTRASTGLVDLR